MGLVWVMGRNCQGARKRMLNVTSYKAELLLKLSHRYVCISVSQSPIIRSPKVSSNQRTQRSFLLECNSSWIFLQHSAHFCHTHINGAIKREGEERNCLRQNFLFPFFFFFALNNNGNLSAKLWSNIT